MDLNKFAKNHLEFVVYRDDHETDEIKPHMTATAETARETCITEEYLREQIQALPMQIQQWGSFAAAARRAMLAEERRYRAWRSKFYLDSIEPPADAEAAKGWKKPTEKQIEAGYRTDPVYASFNKRIEALGEACEMAEATKQAFEAKKYLVKIAVRRSHENAAPMLDV